MNKFVAILLKYPEESSLIVQTMIYSICLILMVRGLWIVTKGFFHLKKESCKNSEELISKPLENKDSLTLYTAKIFFSAYNESLKQKEFFPRSFLEDSARQIASNSFETNYLISITNIANIFPPLGFIGTVFGMIFIFFAKSDPGSSLNTIGLGSALFTTLWALICFVLMEVLRMLLERTAVKRIEAGLQISVKEGHK